MSEYGWSFFEVKRLTKEQMLLFQRKAAIRNSARDEFLATIHGQKLKKKGLDTSNSIAIEDFISGSDGGLTM